MAPICMSLSSNSGRSYKIMKESGVIQVVKDTREGVTKKMALFFFGKIVLK